MILSQCLGWPVWEYQFGFHYGLSGPKRWYATPAQIMKLRSSPAYS